MKHKKTKIRRYGDDRLANEMKQPGEYMSPAELGTVFTAYVAPLLTTSFGQHSSRRTLSLFAMPLRSVSAIRTRTRGWIARWPVG